MSTPRPNTAAILSQLKDFQRDTVEYVFRRLYSDPDCVRRFLVADEVGLGKTLVARGVIAKMIDHLWDRTKRIDVVYVCSNTDIARQNINRMNVTGQDDFSLSSRITLLPLTLSKMQRRKLNFVSFTPGTSFELSQGAGQSLERELLFWLIHNEREVSFVKATRLLEAGATTDAFRNRVKAFGETQETPHPKIAAMFWDRLSSRPDLLQKFDELCEAMPRAGFAVPTELNRQRNRLIGELRRLLAEACLHWLEPDLIILDEFQRFKHLLEGDGDDVSESAQLAHHLFNYQESQSDASLAARVLLLSATPYKMYTLAQEQDQDDHYADFERTLGFLLPAVGERQQIAQLLQGYREQLFRIGGTGIEGLFPVKSGLEDALRRVMVRTERLATTSDRNGMLEETQHLQPRLSAVDVQQYLRLQEVARSVGNDDILEYWKSAPYLLNFMEDYELKRKVRQQLELDQQSEPFLQAMRHAAGGMLARDEIERYHKLDPANARLRAMHGDIIQRGAWRLLWIPPSLTYYAPGGHFADPGLANFTKRLVFSCWRVVPKAIAAVLSYEAEREMVQSFRKKARNTAEARKKRRPLLKFSVSKKRLSGMSVLGIIYPCRWFAERFDPLSIGRQLCNGGTSPSANDLIDRIATELRGELDAVIARASARGGPADEAWYWVAPLMLDRKHFPTHFEKWIYQKDLPDRWAGESAHREAHDSLKGWSRHVEKVREWVDGKLELGPPPDDLCRTLAQSAIAGAGAVSLRALSRLAVESGSDDLVEIQNVAARLAYSFLHLFNVPEVMALLRDKKREIPYWKSVLIYCVDGNLQAVLDEYSHILIESLGVVGQPRTKVATQVAAEMQRSLTLRTSTAQADLLKVGMKRVSSAERPIRIRTRFAMRFGDQDAEDSNEPTRADQVRSAFNSPFWPFVLATTSVGQEGLDFHPYCHAVVHWNLPSNPVDLEQREGRVHRYKGHALRKNIAATHQSVELNHHGDIWSAMFAEARAARSGELNDLFPFWITPSGSVKIERHIPALPHSRDIPRRANLRRALVMYRMVFGQNRQEDLLQFLMNQIPEDQRSTFIEQCRISLAPPRVVST